jgi:hypothetical protein
MLITLARGFALLLCLGILLVPAAHAASARQLDWDDLLPETARVEDPFAKLTREQLLDLSDIAWVRERQAEGAKVSAAEKASARALSLKLKQAGVDADALLARRKEIEQHRWNSRAQLNQQLDGKAVRIPGFVLPIEYSGKLVSEFLLVPWVGACIHTPPPPPNQIVYVKPERPFATEGIFAAVWVTGIMRTAADKRSLFLIDGSLDVDVGYSLKATQVEPYKE